MKKVLLLGGAGFIGFSIAKYLAEKGGYKITIADNFFRAGGKIDSSLKDTAKLHRQLCLHSCCLKPYLQRQSHIKPSLCPPM